MPKKIKQEKNLNTRDKVLHAAALFLEKGYDKTTVRDVAEYAGKSLLNCLL